MTGVVKVTSPRTLVIDIGGSKLKALTLNKSGEPISERQRLPTPDKPTPKLLLAALGELIDRQQSFDRISVGFPGVVVEGVTYTAINLHPGWIGLDLARALESMTDRPVRVANDADIHGLAVVKGRGVELALTLGTGVGSGLYLDGRLVPNLELAHHIFLKNKSYEFYLGALAIERQDIEVWNERVDEAIEQIRNLFSFQSLYLGGGNSKKINFDLPPDVHIVSNMAGLLGGIRLWDFC